MSQLTSVLQVLLVSSMLVEKESGKKNEKAKKGVTISLSKADTQSIPTLPQKPQLSSKWTFWYDLPKGECNNKQDYAKSLEKLETISTVSEFWKQWKNTIQTRDFTNIEECNFRIFKENISPLWEDPKNQKGGKWAIVVQQPPDKKSSFKWRNLMVSILMNEFGYEKDLCGLVISIRKWGWILHLWNSNAENKKRIESVSSKLQKMFRVDTVSYHSHQNTIKKNQQRRKKHSPSSSDDEKLVHKSEVIEKVSTAGHSSDNDGEACAPEKPFKEVKTIPSNPIQEIKEFQSLPEEEQKMILFVQETSNHSSSDGCFYLLLAVTLASTFSLLFSYL